MEFFAKATKVKLVNCHGKYLWADEDGCSVKQSRKGDAPNVVWEVRPVASNPSAIRLRSCYGCYLTGSSQNFLLGMTGKKVLQTNPTRSDDLSQWHAQRYGDSELVKLATSAGSFLHANSGAPPWRNSITHTVPVLAEHSIDILWSVSAVV